MYKQNSFVRLAAALLIAALAGGCAPVPGRDEAGATVDSAAEYREDAAITARVRSALVSDVTLRTFQISAETFKGVVQLHGFIDSPATGARAVALVSRLPGVVSVRNSMIIK